LQYVNHNKILVGGGKKKEKEIKTRRRQAKKISPFKGSRSGGRSATKSTVFLH
jgi:hypothetical protein